MTPNEKLDNIGIERICQMAESDGLLLPQLGGILGISPTSISKWIAMDEARVALWASTRATMAVKCDVDALDALISVDKHGEYIEFARAKGIAEHLWKRAKVLSPEVYGDKMVVTNTIDVSSIRELLEKRQARIDALTVVSLPERVVEGEVIK